MHGGDWDIYIYIYIERERDINIYICTFIYVYIYIYVERERERERFSFVHDPGLRDSSAEFACAAPPSSRISAQLGIIMIIIIIILLPLPPLEELRRRNRGWVFIEGGCSRRGVQWMGVVLHSETSYDII